MIGSWLARGLLDWRSWALLLFLQVPAIPPLLRYTNAPAWAVAIALAAALIMYSALLHAPRALAVVSAAVTPRRIAIALVALAAINAVVYPRVDSLKFARRGSDRDDALIHTSRQILEGRRPIYAPTYLGGAPSVGPIWALAVAPITWSSRTYFLLEPVALACFIALLWKTDRRAAAAASLLLFTSSAGWITMVTGSDLGAVGVVLAGATALLYECVVLPRRGAIVGGMLLLSIAASARVVLSGALILMGGLVARRRPALGTALAAVVALVTAAHYLAWPLSAPLTPFHIVTRTVRGYGAAAVTAAVAICIVAGAFVTWRLKAGRVAFWRAAWSVNAVPLLLVSLAELWGDGFDLRLWSGGVLAPSASLLVAYVALRTAERDEAVIRTRARAASTPALSD